MMARRRMTTTKARKPKFLFIKANVFDGDSICQEKIQRASKNDFTLSRLRRFQKMITPIHPSPTPPPQGGRVRVGVVSFNLMRLF
jgi:hypothetical protein